MSLLKFLDCILIAKRARSAKTERVKSPTLRFVSCETNDISQRREKEPSPPPVARMPIEDPGMFG